MTTPGDGDAKRPEHDPFSRLVHDLANPLSAVLAETQLLLLDAESLTPDAVASLRAIEAAALKMRVVLRESSARR
jgi:signal transduction histidine kinase